MSSNVNYLTLEGGGFWWVSSNDIDPVIIWMAIRIRNQEHGVALSSDTVMFYFDDELVRVPQVLVLHRVGFIRASGN